ncbi:MAG: 3-hydroxyacyl-CoA dehydrogenase [Methylomarinum sp.]|nr:3-hydroxyacyl-CoA dehydrogenase [Methylomarinum sp.]
MNIEKVAVIGAGVMGSGIAAHIANAGVPVYLLDIVPENASNRNVIAESAIAKMLKTAPHSFMHPKNARLVTPGNIEDDLGKLDQVDWVIEAVIENPYIKQTLYQKLAKVCHPDTLISSNTSTLPLSILTDKQSDSFKRRFMITHFFNPPRYMRLLEMVAPAELDPNLLKTVSSFADLRLGKGCVLCKDTPGFIANRIGTYWLQTAVLEAISLNLSVEQCDAVMSLFGVPKTGVFGLLDLIGLDLMPHILKNFKHSLNPKDPLHAITNIPPLIQSMIEQGNTGRKGKGGFYRLQPGSKHKIKQSINLQQGEYSLSKKFQIKDVSFKTGDLQTFLDSDGVLNRYAWRVWSKTLSYTANLINEIADDITAIDSAMKLGYNWRLGPFELLDHLNIKWITNKLEQEQRTLPDILKNRQNLYRTEASSLQYRNEINCYFPLQRPEGVLLLSDIKLQKPPILENSVASLWDIGDGIVCFEFHSKMNTLNVDSMELLQASIKKITDEYQGLVIHNEADNFSAGANLTILTPAILAQDWATVKSIIQLGQNTYRPNYLSINPLCLFSFLRAIIFSVCLLMRAVFLFIHSHCNQSHKLSFFLPL